MKETPEVLALAATIYAAAASRLTENTAWLSLMSEPKRQARAAALVKDSIGLAKAFFDVTNPPPKRKKKPVRRSEP